MYRRPKWVYRPGLHLALRIESGYRPAMAVEDDGGQMVKVRYRTDQATEERWVKRPELVPPPWVGCRRRR